MSPSPNKSAKSKQEEVLRRFSYAEDFKARKRPKLWRYVAAEVLMCLAIGAFFFFHGGIPILSWLSPALIGVLIVGAYIAWTRTSPLCPHCKKNIRTCQAVYCHLCAEPLKDGRCDRCGVLQSWKHIFIPMGQTPGNKQPIRYCPGCAVLLDTDFYRLLGGGQDE
jgi:hypothetical protein